MMSAEAILALMNGIPNDSNTGDQGRDVSPPAAGISASDFETASTLAQKPLRSAASIPAKPSRGRESVRSGDRATISSAPRASSAVPTEPVEALAVASATQGAETNVASFDRAISDSAAVPSTVDRVQAPYGTQETANDAGEPIVGLDSASPAISPFPQDGSKLATGSERSSGQRDGHRQDASFNQVTGVKPRPTPAPPSMDEENDPPYSASGRLGGLRNLLVSLGIQALNREMEYQSPQSDPVRTPERNSYRGPSPDSADADSVVQEPVLVKAQPEFLPPRPMVETTERDRESEQVRPVPERLRGDSPDEVETLPSWRGQYKKRRR